MLRVRETGYGIKEGDVFGRRTVLGWQFQIGVAWFVVMRCECGKVQVVNAHSLHKGKANSCSCGRAIPPSPIFRTRESCRGITVGTTIGRRTVLGWQFSRGRDTTGKAKWAVVVQCSCGAIGVADVAELVRGHAESCGCLIVDTKTKHGWNKRSGRSSLYSIWIGMRERCQRPSNTHWDRYGGRGISVCSEWADGDCFPAFMQWATDNGWKKGLSIDRKDNDGNYEPGNCRWVKPSDQARNKSNNNLVSAFGETKCLAEWLEDPRCGAKCPETITSRIKRGMSNEDAIGTTFKRIQAA